MFGSLSIGIWDLFVIWCLQFVICSNFSLSESVSHLFGNVETFSHLSLTAMGGSPSILRYATGGWEEFMDGDCQAFPPWLGGNSEVFVDQAAIKGWIRRTLDPGGIISGFYGRNPRCLNISFMPAHVHYGLGKFMPGDDPLSAIMVRSPINCCTLSYTIWNWQNRFSQIRRTGRGAILVGDHPNLLLFPR